MLAFLSSRHLLITFQVISNQLEEKVKALRINCIKDAEEHVQASLKEITLKSRPTDDEMRCHMRNLGGMEMNS